MRKLRLLWIYLGSLKAVQYLLLYIFNKRNKEFITIDESFQLFCKHLNKKYTCKRSLFNNFINIYFEINEQNYVMKMRVNSSDFLVWEQIFVREEYKKPIEIVKQKINISDKINIIDCGANIGFFTVYANELFNSPNLILVEPFEGNIDIIGKNLRLSNIESCTIFQKVISYKNDLLFSLNKSYRDGNEWSYQFQSDEFGSYRSIDLKRLISSTSNKKIDILKIDIEGAEFELFLNDDFDLDQLKHVRSIILEIHEDVGSKKELIRFFEKHNFETFDFGETTVFIQND